MEVTSRPEAQRGVPPVEEEGAVFHRKGPTTSDSMRPRAREQCVSAYERDVGVFGGMPDFGFFLFRNECGVITVHRQEIFPWADGYADAAEVLLGRRVSKVQSITGPILRQLGAQGRRVNVLFPRAEKVSTSPVRTAKWRILGELWLGECESSLVFVTREGTNSFSTIPSLGGVRYRLPFTRSIHPHGLVEGIEDVQVESW